MARTAMTVRTRPSAYSTAPLDLAALDTFDNVNGMVLGVNGQIGLMFQNATGGALTLTITSQADAYGRTGDITAYSIAAGHFIWLQEFPATGWASGGLMNLDASGPLKYAAIQRSPGT